eukprot:s916_g2.t1
MPSFSSFSSSSSSSRLFAVQIAMGTAGPHLPAPDRSGHCRTDRSGHCRTSTATARFQLALPDPRSQWALPVLNRELQIPVGTAGPEPRAPDRRRYRGLVQVFLRIATSDQDYVISQENYMIAVALTLVVFVLVCGLCCTWSFFRVRAPNSGKTNIKDDRGRSHVVKFTRSEIVAKDEVVSPAQTARSSRSGRSSRSDKEKTTKVLVTWEVEPAEVLANLDHMKGHGYVAMDVDVAVAPRVSQKKSLKDLRSKSKEFPTVSQELRKASQEDDRLEERVEEKMDAEEALDGDIVEVSLDDLTQAHVCELYQDREPVNYWSATHEMLERWVGNSFSQSASKFGPWGSESILPNLLQLSLQLSVLPNLLQLSLQLNRPEQPDGTSGEVKPAETPADTGLPGKSADRHPPDTSGLFGKEVDLEELFGDLSKDAGPSDGGIGDYHDGPEDFYEEPLEPQTLADHFETMDRARMDRIFFENSMMCVGAGLHKLPWEEGVFAQIFGNPGPMGYPLDSDFTPMPAFPVFPGHDDEAKGPEPVGVMAFREMPLFAKHVKALCDADYNQSLNLKWTRALACWLTILESSRFESLVGAYVMEKLMEKDREGALTYVRDACGVKSPNTVLKRARDLQQFINWCVTGERSWWPLQERYLLDFLSACEGDARSKFIGKNLVHALKFFKFVMGANFNLEEVVGPLLQGRVQRVLATRDPTQQARPLTVDEVLALEQMVSGATNVLDKYFAGCMLFALYSRARWSDLACMQCLFYDVVDTHEGPFGFVEARTRIHKTSSSAEKKALYLPFVAPIQGIGEGYWGLAWKEALQELGLLHDREPYGAICRAPTSVGGFTKRPLTTAEISAMLNDFLKLTDTEDATSSHSLKATTLVWAARYGIDDDSRAMLGHHSIEQVLGVLL